MFGAKLSTKAFCVRVNVRCVLYNCVTDPIHTYTEEKHHHAGLDWAGGLPKRESSKQRRLKPSVARKLQYISVSMLLDHSSTPSKPFVRRCPHSCL